MKTNALKAVQNVEKKLGNSFYLVRNDMAALQNANYLLLKRIEALEYALAKRIVIRQYVGNRMTGEVHSAHCLLARSTDAQMQAVFNSVQAAKMAGYSACICLS